MKFTAGSVGPFLCHHLADRADRARCHPVCNLSELGALFEKGLQMSAYQLGLHGENVDETPAFQQGCGLLGCAPLGRCPAIPPQPLNPHPPSFSARRCPASGAAE
jgi:hypothetical protein